MGFLRFYLAMCVVMAHASPVLPWPVLDGRQAVQMFFMISGFYMQFVLSTKYASLKSFYTSRLLRIFVPYFVALALVVVISVLSGLVLGDWLAFTPYSAWRENGVTGVLITATTNITLFFQDWVMFLTQDSGKSLQFTANFWNSASPLWHYLLIPQAWSIGVELSYYLVVPLLARKFSTKMLCGLIVTSQVARFLVYGYLGAAHDPWTYRFFPFELAHFAYGMLAARLYFMLKARRIGSWQSSWQSYVALVSVLLVAFSINAALVRVLKPYVSIYLPFGSEVLILGSFVVWVPLIAGLFILTKNSTIDRFLGELSYPIYLVHYVIVGLAGALVAQGILMANMVGWFAVVASILVSVLLVVLALNPFERWRALKIASLTGVGARSKVNFSTLN
ncbi:acyltransferase [Thermomonas sp.]|uniref:acyltransferase family protein n=1 Tax=Thermomonas sp. TaxID=1971895 RepID=UPI0024896EB8|nr:acyltransferase [Thermomonas sp.]MDI1253516.1 acyltransferase [Thermomonas sp.]